MVAFSHDWRLAAVFKVPVLLEVCRQFAAETLCATDRIGVIEYPDGGTYADAVFTRASIWDDPSPPSMR